MKEDLAQERVQDLACAPFLVLLASVTLGWGPLAPHLHCIFPVQLEKVPEATRKVLETIPKLTLSRM